MLVLNVVFTAIIFIYKKNTMQVLEMPYKWYPLLLTFRISMLMLPEIISI